MAKKKIRRRRTFSEKVIIVLGILIAISMILSLIFISGTSQPTSSGYIPEPNHAVVESTFAPLQPSATALLPLAAAIALPLL